MCGLHLSGLFKPFVIDPDPGLPLTCAVTTQEVSHEYLELDILEDSAQSSRT